MIEQAVAEQFQGFPNEADHLYMFHSRFRPGYTTKMAFVSLLDDLVQDMEHGKCNHVNYPESLSGF